MGIGKTREGIEALRRLERRLGEPITILFPTTPFTASISLPSDIPKNHIVLFIDNLHNPPYYTPSRQSESTAKAGDFPTWFRECLTHFKGHADFRVIATVRNDLRDRDYEKTMESLRPLIKEFGFEEFALPSWDQNNVDILIRAMAVARGITIPDDARKELARRCTAEGTPNYARLAISRIEPGKTVNIQEVQTLPKTFNDLWQKTWDERIASYPERICLFNSLALLRQAGVTPTTLFTLEVAARLCGKPWWWHRRKVRASISAVSPWIEKKAATLECPEAYLPRDVSIAQRGHVALLAQTLCDFFSKAPEAIFPELANFASLLTDFPLGNRAQNLEESIACYKRALGVYTKEAFPEDWAGIQNNLGIAYVNRRSGDMAQNLEKAIACCKFALEVYTKESFPQKWATVQNNLGGAYWNRISGDSAQNREEAIVCCRRALEVHTREAFPEQWAMTQINLGNAFANRISGDRAQNLEEAIACYKRALEVYTREAFPERWALTHYNLGTTFSNRISGDRAQNLEEAIACYKRALEVYTREALPEDWAMTQNNLGAAYGDRISGDKAQNLEEAIARFKLVLEVYTKETFPEKHERVIYNLKKAEQVLEDYRKGHPPA